MHQHTPTSPDVEHRFEEHGLRCTRQRRAIYETLANSTAHPTADQIYRGVAPHVSGVSLATVYNTLEAFCRCGLAQKIAAHPNGAANQPARYDATTKQHLHIRCKTTGQIFDIPDELSHQLLEHIPKDLLAKIEAKLGVHIDQVQVELLGRKAEN